MPDFSTEELLTVAAVASLLQVTQQTVRNWLDQGRIPSLRIGRRVRILHSDFQRFVDSSYSTGTRTAPAADTTAAEGFWEGSWTPDGPVTNWGVGP